MKTNVLYSFLQRNDYLLIAGIITLTLITFALTLVPAEMLSQNKIWSYDKVGHLLLFGSWTLLLGLYHNISQENNTNFWIIFLLGLGFGVLIEFLQYSLPSINRHADIYDVLFDAIGCLLAIVVLKKVIPEK
ncbi:VanZ family protein [Fodinibius salsisoli]|uniref:VanZ family protein n=1 Tax=Fodinibius salsisoli TaxID=2820877 RepID=A0ABT3PPU2_9BACT|nr:VanZ family protein [Fodinibius salsisoli]MCW9707872.1 VanZ family protein [Fodinibius salsisoli]